MAVVMQMRWDGVTPQQYDEIRDVVLWERVAPAGGKFHVAWFEDGGLRVLDVWETPEHFQSFLENELAPGIQKVGIQGEPQVTFSPAHRVFDATHSQVIAE